MDIKDEFLALLKDAVDETGIELSETLERISDYAAQRAEHLALGVDEPGFASAVRAERDNVALFAGLAVAGDLDQVDGQLLGLIKGMLTLAAKILAA